MKTKLTIKQFRLRPLLVVSRKLVGIISTLGVDGAAFAASMMSVVF